MDMTCCHWDQAARKDPRTTSSAGQIKTRLMSVQRKVIFGWLAVVFGISLFATVPSSMEFDKFAAFVAQRNIFDPNRSADAAFGQLVQKPLKTVKEPVLMLVGTMSYEKGLFAFFDGDNSDLRKVVTPNTQIAGYTITEIDSTGVIMQSNGTVVKLHVGDSMPASKH